jgi:hypothetical protein
MYLRFVVAKVDEDSERDLGIFQAVSELARGYKAISWFKDTAKEHLARARELVAILENHGLVVTMLKAERVGYVVYEDDFQIVAEPFAETKC